jgi:squalene-hopene/tetraprenyl-beta-curcumene cyclase
MKRRTFLRGAVVGCVWASSLARLGAAPLVPRDANGSLMNEIRLAVEKALGWMLSVQGADGAWSNAAHPAITALVLNAMDSASLSLGLSADRYQGARKRGLSFLRSQVKPDGGIYAESLTLYNTALSLTALLRSGEAGDRAITDRAAAFVAAQQARGMDRPELNGGIGYGPTGVSPKRQHPDLDNTLVALEALRAHAEARKGDAAGSAIAGLDWKAATDFVGRCQNLKVKNDGVWVSEEGGNRGGFVYYPGFSNAGTQEFSGGRTALRSYGSMSYAGLLSFIYAEMPREDERMKAALQWLSENYTTDENPGLGKQGLFYYFFLMTKALSLAGFEEITVGGGKKVAWARPVALKIMDLQSGDGWWENDVARWMEKDRVLVTAYCVAALSLLARRV